MRIPLLILYLFILSGSIAQNDSIHELDLSEMKVSAERKREISFQDGTFFITDFHIDHRGTFLLLKQLSNYMILVLDPNEKPVDTVHLDFRPTSLYMDCNGNLHVFSKEYLFQLGQKNGKWQIVAANTLQYYVRYLKNCVASNRDVMIYQASRDFGQTVEYYAVSKNIGDSYTICTVEDRSQIRSDYEENYEIQSYRYSGHERMSDIDPRSKQMESIRERYAREERFRLFVNRPAYHPLFLQRDTCFLFNHILDSLYILDIRGRVLGTKLISYQYDRFWKPLLYFDRARTMFYSVNERNGIQFLSTIHAEPDLRRTNVPVEHAVYPDKIIVYNGYAYYAYRPYIEANLNKLYRQRL